MDSKSPEFYTQIKQNIILRLCQLVNLLSSIQQLFSMTRASVSKQETIPLLYDATSLSAFRRCYTSCRTIEQIVWESIGVPQPRFTTAVFSLKSLLPFTSSCSTKQWFCEGRVEEEERGLAVMMSAAFHLRKHSAFRRHRFCYNNNSLLVITRRLSVAHFNCLKSRVYEEFL